MSDDYNGSCIQEAIFCIIESAEKNGTGAALKSKSKHVVTDSPGEGSYGPLSTVAFERLHVLRESLYWSEVDNVSMETLMELLLDHVAKASSIDLFHAAEKACQEGHLPNRTDKRCVSFQISILKSGLEAALTLAFILTSPGIDPTLIGAETIGSCVALMRHHMLKHIIPALSPINLVLNDSGRQPGSEKTDGSNKMNTASRKRSIRKISAAEKTLQNAESYSHIFELAGSILSFVDVFTNLMDKMDYLCHKVQFEDQQLLAIVDTCLRTITLDPFSSNCFSADRALTLIRSLHGCVISLMTTIFNLHSRLREGILQDILPLILKLPTSSKKSVRYFQVSSYFGLCASGTTSENNSRLCSNYRADVHIQTFSVLILQIIQSAVSMPNASNLEGLIDVSQNSEHAHCSKQELELKSQDAIQGLGFCKKAIAYVVTELITRCNKKTDEASEFRTFLSNFIEDLLLINLNPEYPAAEAMLHALCNQILDMILQCSSIGSPNKVNSKVLLVEGGFLVSAVDILGSVSADIAYKRLCLRKHPVKLPKTPSDKCEKIASVQSNPSNSRQEGHVDDFSFRADDCGCICDRKFVDTFMLDCDQCHRWFHGSCVGIPRDKPLKIWVCDDCRLYERVWKQANSLCTPYACTTDREFSQRDHIQIMRLVLLQDLNKKSRLINHMLGLKCARWYWLAHWLESSLPQKQVNDVIESRVLSRRFLSDWYFPGEKHSLMQAVDDSAFETPANILLSLFCFSSSLACFYPQLLAFLIAITGDPSAGLRKAGVRALAQVIDVDSNLMNQREVRDVVAKMLLDDFISVREAAITLVSKFMNRVPQLCNVFHGILLDRLNNDTGVSVRKRVVKILRELVLSQNTIYRGRTSATVALLERMINPQEDDSVRDLIQETFVMLWFDPHHSSQYHVSDGTMTPRNNSNTASSIACQMVDVMKLSEHSAHIVSLIRELCTCPSPKLLSRKDGKEKYCVRSNEKLLNCDSFQTSSDIEKHITLIASSLVEQLLSFEGVHSTDTNVIGHFDHSSGDELTAIIRTVSIFSESVPCSLVKHIDSLIPFLKADNGIREDHEATVVMHVCKIMSNLVQTINTFELLKFSHKSLIEDLNRIVYRFGSAAMSASIAFMARLSEKYVAAATTENVHEENLFMLASKFYSYLLKTKDAMQFISATSPKVISNLHRSITGLGLICRFNKSLIAEPVSAMNLQIIPASQLTWSNIGASAFAVFEYYCEHGDTNTRCHSLRAITAVCISEPRILLAAEQRGLFARSMYMDCDVDMISTCLGCWEEMLISEELRLENGDAKREMHQRDVSLVEQISGDQDGEASLFGSCCIQHSRVLLEISLHKNAHVRYQSLSLTDVLLRQGLMNPMEVVPYLFCLQGDVDTKIQQYALKLLLREGDRRPDMLRQRLYGGICGAFHFQRKLEDKPQPTALTDSSVNSCHSQLRHTFSEIFKHFISSSRSQCIKILSSLVESFRHSSHSSPSKSAASAASINANEQKSERILFHRFIAETIAHFPYYHLGDLLYVLNLIDSLVALDGFAVSAAFECIIRAFSINTDFEDNKGKGKVEKELSKILMNRSDSSNEFLDICLNASSIILLMKIKLFLCKVYGVTEARLREFQQGSTDSEKVITQPDDMTIFSSSVPMQSGECGQPSTYTLFKELFRVHCA